MKKLLTFLAAGCILLGGCGVDADEDMTDKAVTVKSSSGETSKSSETSQTAAPKDYLRQYRTKTAWRLCCTSTCRFSVISPKSSLKYGSITASDLGNLTKNLTAYLHNNLCAVLP